ncbi:MAG: uracil phosphoribosyltransferase [Dysgonamonadaceae bacterium]|jgi:uracil phosphoribosyltransferase|nr:uracil phosphoribosyltransferase [Dysgonamonadaceae bacterium]
MNINNLGENNSILNQFIAELRDIHIHDDRLRFRKNIERIGEIMAYEISKTLQYKTIDVQTPLGVKAVSVPCERIVLATILRAGLPFHQGFLSYFDRAENAFISASRKYTENHSDFSIETGYLSSPSIEGKTLIIADPMLATGSSLNSVYRNLLQRGNPAKIHVACVIAGKQGIDAACKIFPEGKTAVWVAAVDPHLDEKAYIVPGLGDAGDLAYGETI